MKTHFYIRTEMMTVLKTSLEDVGANHKIVFKDNADIIICEVLFTELKAVGGNSEYEFIGYDSTPVLKSIVLQPGVVSKFTIEGKVESSITTVNSGTVGGLNSMADIKFNNTNWATTGSSISLRLKMFIQEG